jgi:Mn-dependent DtxR family transcriptional regulator
MKNTDLDIAERILDLLDGHSELATINVARRLKLEPLYAVKLLRQMERAELVEHSTRGGSMYWRTL